MSQSRMQPMDIETGIAPTPQQQQQQQQQQQPQPQPQNDENYSWMSNKRDTLLVAITLITTLTFQAGINPPGGCWQQDDKNKGQTAGHPIMLSNDSSRYWIFWVVNWLSFYSSVNLIIGLLTGTSLESREMRWGFLFTVSSIIFTFLVSQPKYSTLVAFGVWCLVIFISYGLFKLKK